MASLYPLLLVCSCFVQTMHGQDFDLTILVAEWNPGQVFHVSLSTSTLKPVPIRSVLRPVAVDYDPQTKDIYWSDVRLKQINAINLLGTNERIIVSLNPSAVPDGLAVDATNRKIFYTDTGYDVIVSMDMNGTNRDVIINSGLDQPRAIVLHEEIRKLYYTDWGSSPFIATADYDGGNRNKIVTSELGWPNGLALDKQNGILYWCDAQTHKIESVKTDGTQRRMIVNEPSAHYFDIFLNQGTLYFTDWKRRAILNMPANGGTIGTVSSPRISQLAGLHVFSNLNASENCPNNRYGLSCIPCGRCADGDVCNRTSGICPSGCQAGWTGNKCDTECTAGTYGTGCQSVCGNCLGGLCNHVDGRCENGCTSGWQGADCKTACGRCANGDVCNPLSGYCPSGCLAGWTGNKCETACPANIYGRSCIDCGHCDGGVSCDRGNGACPGGCQDGWKGSQCNTRDESSESLPLVVVIGAAAGGVAVLLIVVIIVIIVAVVLLRRRKTPKRLSDEDPHYATLDSVRQSNIYSVPDVPPTYSTIKDAESRNPMDGYTGLREAKTGVANLGYASPQSSGQDSNDYMDATPLSVVREGEYDLAVA